MPHRLAYVAVLAMLATTAVWHGPAFADDWYGSATCTATTTEKSYSNTETHKWEITGPKSSGGAGKEYNDKWTATGNGANTLNSWVTNGGGDPTKNTLQFVVLPDNLLHVFRVSSQQTDPQGILVTPKGGGNSFHATVGEILFPNIPAVDPTRTHIENPSPPPSTTTTGSGGFFLAPSDSTTVTTCTWNFNYGTPPVAKPSPGTVLQIPPGGLNLKGKPTGGIRPPGSLSIFFGGPGGGGVTAALSAPKIICFSDCSLGDFGSQGLPVTLTAAPDATSVFAGWGGSCSGTSTTCSFTLGSSNSAIAYFRSKFKTVSAGAYHNCALRPSAGDVVCWGRNDEGEVGPGRSPLPPSPVTGITNAVAIAAGGYHTCALLVGGTVACWGKGNDGQLGDWTHFPAANPTPTIVPGITEVLAVTAGGAHTCVVHAGGSASCWGLNGDNQLGAPSTPSHHSPTPVTVALGAVGPLTKQIAAGAYHTCAIVAADSTVFCWGSNSDGQRGIGTGELTVAKVIAGPGCGGSPFYEACAGPDTVLTATTIAAAIGVGYLVSVTPLGGFHTVALDSSGGDWGWGNNNDGQVPTGGERNFAMKDPSPPAPTPVKIAAGAYHTCILDSTLGVFCRGNNNDKQSGPTPPGFVPMTASAVDVAAGGYHTCAVIVSTPSTPAAGSVACWGRNWEGEVDGTSQGPDVTTPVLLTVP